MCGESCSQPSIALRHLPELSAVEALVEATETMSAATATASLIADQKLLQHTASESAAAAFTELIALAARAHTKPREPRGGGGGGATAPPTLCVRELLPLVAMFYSLVGHLAVGSSALVEHEQRLREGLLQASRRTPPLAALSHPPAPSRPPLSHPPLSVLGPQACLRDPAAGGLLAPGVAPRPIEEFSTAQIGRRRDELDTALRRVFERLRALATARRGLGPSSETLLLKADQTAGEVYRPMLRHLVERALRHEDVSEMRRVGEASIGSLFSRGANLLGVKRSARLTDHRTIVIFVLGGISLVEMRELRQLVAQHPKHRLIIGATSLAAPHAVWQVLTRNVHVGAPGPTV